ncbi:uncharacterized protein [Argopecten irradians]|uniref:uncharacterized protein n=1 Tax=Argopecten irradians TaxID=31199 RepID=UPI003721A95D
MAVMASQQVGIRDIGEKVIIPHHPIARAMYLLKCLCDVLDLDEGSNNLQKLTDFRNYHLLSSESDIEALAEYILSLKPDELKNKCIFLNEEMCGNSNNKFFELAEVRQNMIIMNKVLVAGQQRRVKKIMVYNRVWLNQYLVTPLHYLSDQLKRIKEERQARLAQRAIAYPGPPHQSTYISAYSEHASGYSYPGPQRVIIQPTYSYPPYQPTTSSCCTIL